jgi:signal transduction histidine kinase
MRALLGRPALISLLAGLVLTAIAQAELWLLWMPDPDEAVGAVPVAARAAAAIGAAPLTLWVALGRRLPLAGVALAIPAVALLPAGPLETSVALACALAIAAFRAGEGARDLAERALGLAGLGGIVVTTAVAHPGSIDELADLAMLVIVLSGPWLAGLGIRVRGEREAALEAAAARAEASRRADSARAAADERSRIARELHDVVAHAISVIVLQARGGRRAIAAEPEAAAQALDDIETTASLALAEMRRLVDVLRPGAGEAGLEPPPGLAMLDALAGSVRDAGLEVDVTVTGRPVELVPGVDLAAYRLIQEALTNTLRHAQGRAAAHVAVRYQPGVLELEIVDDGATVDAPEPGHGILGMRERAAIYGGSVEFGPRPEGGFRVVARLPIVTHPA